MKDSGIEWIGKIPEEWEVKKIKYVSSITMGQSPNSDDYNIEGIGIPFLQGNADFTNRYPFEKIYCVNANKFSQPLDILFSVRAPVGAKNISDKVYAIGRGLCAITPKQINNNLMWYLIDIINCEFSFNARGSTYDSVTINDVNNSKIPIHSPTEQKAIADFLDKKCAVIDDTIEKQKLVIEKLHLYKQSLITETVTKGLDPTAKMKPSGIEWIGDIPQDWDIRKLGTVASVQTGPFGSQLHNKDYVDEGTPIITVEHFGEMYIIHNDLPRVLDEDLKRLNKYSLKTGDLVFSRVGSVDRSVLVRDTENGWLFSGRCLRVRFDNYIVPQYINYCFCKLTFKQYMGLVAVGCTMPSINTTILNNIRIAVPSFAEQQVIADYLDTKCAKIDSIIIGKQRLISKLTDYKNSLIYECVTGKREVI